MKTDRPTVGRKGEQEAGAYPAHDSVLVHFGAVRPVELGGGLEVSIGP